MFLPYGRGLPHLPGVSHLHVNRPLEIKRTFDRFTLAHSCHILKFSDCRRISIIVHRSASDKPAVVHSSYLFGAKSYFGQRERKSVWQGFQSNICELVSGKLSRVFVYTQLYAPYNFI